MHARINMNGNSAEDFKKAYYSLTECQKTIEATMGDLRRFYLHGRNYQHLDGMAAVEAQGMDDEELAKLVLALTGIVEMKRGIEAAITEYEK
jgi:hypothetical protein